MSELDHTLQPVQTEPVPASAPVNPPVKVTTSADALDRAPQIVEGRVRVSDDISQQAVDQGYEPDVQPKAAAPAITVETGVGDSLGAQPVVTVLPDTTAGQIQGLRAAGKDAEADAIVAGAAAQSAALEAMQAPISVQAAVAAENAPADAAAVAAENAPAPVVEPQPAPAPPTGDPSAPSA